MHQRVGLPTQCTTSPHCWTVMISSRMYCPSAEPLGKSQTINPPTSSFIIILLLIAEYNYYQHFQLYGTLIAIPVLVCCWVLIILIWSCNGRVATTFYFVISSSSVVQDSWIALLTRGCLGKRWLEMYEWGRCLCTDTPVLLQYVTNLYASA